MNVATPSFSGRAEAEDFLTRAGCELHTQRLALNARIVGASASAVPIDDIADRIAYLQLMMRAVREGLAAASTK
jgi:hypothetical protein